MIQGRHVAYKIWISDLLTSIYQKNEGEWESHYFLIDEKKISRVNIIARVISKYLREDGGYAFFELDDGSGIIRTKLWGEDVRLSNGLEIGDLVLVIGRPRKYNNEIYLLPEILRFLENWEWAKLRKLELEKEYGVRNIQTQEKSPLMNTDEEKESGLIYQTSRLKILSFLHKEEEVHYESLIKNIGMNEKEVESIIKELVKEGEIYMPRPGILRVI